MWEPPDGDFHNFNMVYRDDPTVEVVAFTAAQIADIDGRCYPPSLAGRLYPRGIPILKEAELEGLCRAHSVDEAVFAYSDVPHEHVMHVASRAGADFTLLGPKRTMLHSSLPVIAITAVRTGCGKSAIARWLSLRLRQRGLHVAVLRHPMPYGDLAKQHAQRFASMADLDSAQCTAEEREDYEPHIMVGNVVFAGVDYAEVLRMAEAEADIIVWDGGNNDFPFVKWPMRCAPARFRRTTRARPSLAWRTCWSSTRPTRRLLPMSNSPNTASGPSTRLPSSCAPPLRSDSMMRRL